MIVEILLHGCWTIVKPFLNDSYMIVERFWNDC